MSESIKKLKQMGAVNLHMKLFGEGIFKISFSINGVQLHAQADIDNRGIYAIQVPSLDGLKKLIERSAE
tara:strand:- start:1777 stop:1983 length:207 start_codon:yes stop_codon:yes gene_type:complete